MLHIPLLRQPNALKCGVPLRDIPGCDGCKLENYWPQPAHSIEAVRQGALQYCCKCHPVFACIIWATRFLNFEDITGVYTPYDGHLVLEIPRNSSDCPHLQCTWIAGESATMAAAFTPVKMLPRSTRSLQTFSLIQRWLQECVESHRCGSQPSRVNDRPPVAGIRFLLIDGNRISLQEDVEPRRYACLSHCWGSKELLATTKATLATHLHHGLPIIDLPQTFQDAVSTCCNLGISYIWIDSLCIVQDDPGDWRRQSARMADVYENCFLTIAATHASNAAEGLFYDTSWELRGDMVPGYTNLYVWRLPPSPSKKAPEGTWTESPQHHPSQWPLLTRGWTYQELSLSPRTLHFGAQEVFWRCQQTHQQQCSTIPFERISAFTLNDLRSTEAVILGKGYIQQEWYNAVQEYSGRQLTFDKDRLPAIAAIAQQIWRLRPDDQYLAGLWRSTFLFDLMWYCSEESVDRSHCEPEPHIRMPTWSWAITRSQVVWPWILELQYDPPGRPLNNVTVLNIIHNHHGPAISGEISEASIELRAPLINLNAALAEWAANARLPQREQNEERWPKINSEMFHSTGIPWELRLTSFHEDFLEEYDPLNDDVFGLPLIFCDDANSAMFEYPSCEQHLLTVRRSETGGTYERNGVGVVTLAPAESFLLSIFLRSRPEYSGADAPGLLLQYFESLLSHDITLV